MATNQASRDLIRAATLGQPDTVRALLDSGIGVDTCGANGLTALMVSARHGRLLVVRELLARGADPRRVSAEKLSALNYATDPEVVRLLLASGGIYAPVMPLTDLRFQVSKDQLDAAAVGERALRPERRAQLLQLLLDNHEIWYFEKSGGGPLPCGGGWAIVYCGIVVREFATWRA